MKKLIQRIFKKKSVLYFMSYTDGENIGYRTKIEYNHTPNELFEWSKEKMNEVYDLNKKNSVITNLKVIR